MIAEMSMPPRNTSAWPRRSRTILDDLLVAYSEAFEDAPDSERWHEMLKDIFAASLVRPMQRISFRPSSTGNETRKPEGAW
jgi:hypothetical protein